MYLVFIYFRYSFQDRLFFLFLFQFGAENNSNDTDHVFRVFIALFLSCFRHISLGHFVLLGFLTLAVRYALVILCFNPVLFQFAIGCAFP